MKPYLIIIEALDQRLSLEGQRFSSRRAATQFANSLKQVHFGPSVEAEICVMLMERANG